MKYSLLAAGLAVMVVTSACGGGSEGSDNEGSGAAASTEATVEDYCAAYIDAGSAEDGAAIKEWTSGMVASGTPADMPDVARAGFEIFVRETDAIADDATQDEINQKEIPAGDEEKVEAWTSYSVETCASVDVPAG